MPRTYPETTVVDVTLGHTLTIAVYRQEPEGTIQARVSYEVLTDEGDIHHTGDIVKQVGGASLTKLKSWVDNHFLPDINAQEGMS